MAPGIFKLLFMKKTFFIWGQAYFLPITPEINRCSNIPGGTRGLLPPPVYTIADFHYCERRTHFLLIISEVNLYNKMRRNPPLPWEIMN